MANSIFWSRSGGIISGHWEWQAVMIACKLIPSRKKFVSSKLVSSLFMGDSMFSWGNSKRRTKEFLFFFLIYVFGAGFGASGSRGVGLWFGVCEVGNCWFSGENGLEESRAFGAWLWWFLGVAFFVMFTAVNPSGSDFRGLGVAFFTIVSEHSWKRCPCSWHLL